MGMGQAECIMDSCVTSPADWNKNYTHLYISVVMRPEEVIFFVSCVWR